MNDTYKEQVAAVKEKYEKRILSVLNRIQKELNADGFHAEKVFAMVDSMYEWHLCVNATKDLSSDIVIDISLEIAESREYDGTNAGINFSFMMVAIGGEIIAQMTPHNYSSKVWVALDDPDAIEERFLPFEEIETNVIISMITEFMESR